MLPQEFLHSIAPFPQLAGLPQALQEEPTVAIRINPAKGPMPIPEGAEPVAWCPGAYHLSHRPKFTFDPRLHQGIYYVQDASSMAITAAIRAIAPSSPVRYLDACAAPGGKTTAAIASLPAGSLIVANEYDPKRAEILAENLAKWGSPYAIATRGDTSRIRSLPGFFHIIAVDAPCSGEGMMRKDPEAVRQWSPALVSSCAALQREILDNAWQALAPGGHLIYSTCTFNHAENEANLAWLISTHGAIPLPIPELDAIPSICGPLTGWDSLPCYRFIPGRVRGEGLFLALLQKPGAGGAAPSRAKLPKAAKTPPEIASWLDPAIQWHITLLADEIIAQPLSVAPDIAAVLQHLTPVLPGLRLATLKSPHAKEEHTKPEKSKAYTRKPEKGRDCFNLSDKGNKKEQGAEVIPAHELALSTALRRGAFPEAELTLEQAIAYLQRQAITINAPRGIVLLTYQGHPLGFAKNLGSRANNLYPKHWRIRSTL